MAELTILVMLHSLCGRLRDVSSLNLVVLLLVLVLLTGSVGINVYIPHHKSVQVSLSSLIFSC